MCANKGVKHSKEVGILALVDGVDGRPVSYETPYLLKRSIGSLD